MSGLEEAVGLGVTIALTDLFSEAAEKIISKFEALEEKAQHGAHAVREAIESLELGLGMAGAGAAILTPLALFGDRAVETAEKVERLKMAYEAMATNGEELFDRVRLVANELRLFPTESVLEAGKYMRAMGVAAERIPNLLRASGIAATVMDESLESVAGRLQMLSVYAEQGILPRRMLTQLGVSVADLAAEGVKLSKGRLLSSTDDLMAAVAHVIERRMGDAAAKLREGLPGIEADAARQFRLFYQRAGEAGLVELKTRIAQGFLGIIHDLDLSAVGTAFGHGLASVYELLSPIGAALESIVHGLAGVIGRHPGVVQLLTTLAGLVGIALAAAGGIVILTSAVKFASLGFRLLRASALESLTEIWAGLVSLMPTILPLVAAASLLYLAWESNFGGLRDTVTRWWDALRSIVAGVVELFSDDGNGQIGSIPAALHDRLVDQGLWGIVKSIYLWGARVGALFSGIWLGIREGVEAAAVVFRALVTPIEWLLRGFEALTNLLSPTNEAFDGINQVSQKSLDLMRDLGEVLGVLAVGFGIYQGLLLSARIATTAWGAAQWMLNLALNANPVGVLVLLIGLLVAGIATAIANVDELRESFEEMLDIAPMRWMMKQAGIIPEGATDADIDEAMAGRTREYDAKRRRRAELGRDDFVSRLQDNLGLPGGADLDAPPGMTPEDASARNPASSFAQLNAGLVAAARPATTKPADQHIHVYLDGQQIHSTVVRHEESLANRAGD